MRSPSASPRSSARPSQSSRPRTRLSEHAMRRAVRRRDMVVRDTDGLIDQGHRNRRGLHGAVLASRRLERWHRRRTQRGRRQTKGRGKEMVEGPPRPVGHRVVDLDASTSRTARLAGAPRFAGARPGPGKRSGVRHLDGRWPAVTLTRGSGWLRHASRVAAGIIRRRFDRCRRELLGRVREQLGRIVRHRLARDDLPTGLQQRFNHVMSQPARRPMQRLVRPAPWDVIRWERTRDDETLTAHGREGPELCPRGETLLTHTPAASRGDEPEVGG